jgi:hypothetical protein
LIVENGHENIQTGSNGVAYFTVIDFFILSSHPVTSYPSLLKKERGMLENGIFRIDG